VVVVRDADKLHRKAVSLSIAEPGELRVVAVGGIVLR
jgi:hypothetical protein